MSITAANKRLLNNLTPGSAKAKLGDEVDALDAATQPATTTTAGIVKQGAVFADLTGNPLMADFNALLANLRTAGIIAT